MHRSNLNAQYRYDEIVFVLANTYLCLTFAMRVKSTSPSNEERLQADRQHSAPCCDFSADAHLVESGSITNCSVVRPGMLNMLLGMFQERLVPCLWAVVAVVLE